jgi:putative glutamine amidotransferase
VSSYHHQAIDVLGSGLLATARAADGVIEAVEHVGGTLLGVQWHPEDLARTSVTDAALFQDLVARASGFRRSSPGLASVEPRVSGSKEAVS